MVKELRISDGTVIRHTTSKGGSTPHHTREIRIEPQGRSSVPQTALDALTADIQRYNPQKPDGKPQGRPTRIPQTLYQWPDAAVHPKVVVKLHSLTPEQMLTDSQRDLLRLIRQTPHFHPNKKPQH